MKAYDFRADEVVKDIVEWIKQLKETQGMNKVVIGISGGKDSTIAAALCVKALGSENVIGLLMPNGVQKDISDSFEVCDYLNIEYRVFNIEQVYNAELNMLIENSWCNDITQEAMINIAPRIRMMTLYAFGQSIGARVCGTGNLSERLLGYFTKFGDGASDFNPLGDLTSKEVVMIGDALKLPKGLVHKIPDDGLSGMSDEEKLGLKYEDVHNYIRGLEVNDDVKQKIERYMHNSKHKLESIPMYLPSDKYLYRM